MVDIPVVAALILNYNNWQDTIICVESIFNGTYVPEIIIIVDNGSTDKSVDFIENWATGNLDFFVTQNLHIKPVDKPLFIYNDLKDIETSDGCKIFLIKNNENSGFSEGNNIGIQISLCVGADFVWILNNDTIVEPHALEFAVHCMEECQTAGICGMTLLGMSGENVIQCAGGGTLNRYTGETELFGNNVEFSEVNISSLKEKFYLVQWISGASALVRRSVFDEDIFLPEEYFLYYEDVAFSQHILRHGFTLIWSENSLVYHKEGGTSGAKGCDRRMIPRRSILVDYLSVRNRYYFLRKMYPYSLFIAVPLLLGVMINRILRRQYYSVFIVCKAAICGIFGYMGKPKREIV